MPLRASSFENKSCMSGVLDVDRGWVWGQYGFFFEGRQEV